MTGKLMEKYEYIETENGSFLKDGFYQRGMKMGKFFYFFFTSKGLTIPNDTKNTT